MSERPIGDVSIIKAPKFNKLYKMKNFMLVLNPQSRVINESAVPTINGKTLFEVHERLLHLPSTITREEQRWYATEAYNLFGTQTVASFLMPAKELVDMSIDDMIFKVNKIDTASEEFQYMVFILSAKCNEHINIELTAEQALLDMYGSASAQRTIITDYMERIVLKKQLKEIAKDFKK